MANFGNTTTPATGFFFDDVGNSQFWSFMGTFPGGIVTDLYVYFAGDGAGVTAQLVIWNDTAATIAWQSGNISVAAGTRAVGGQAWQHVTVPNIYLSPHNIDLGLWTSGNVVWTFESSGSTNFQRSLASGPGSLAAGGTESGSNALGAYVVYQPSVAHVRRGGVWSAGAQPKVRRGGAWVGASITAARRSGVWKSGT